LKISAQKRNSPHPFHSLESQGFSSEFKGFHSLRFANPSGINPLELLCLRGFFFKLARLFRSRFEGKVLKGGWRSRKTYEKVADSIEMTKVPNSLVSRIEAIVSPQVKTLGYELLDLEYQARSPLGGPVLRLFIESLAGKPISFEDCVTVDHGLDALFESPEFEAVLADTFTLEVSSPGLDRPLKKPDDFVKYEGQKAQIKTFRPLTEPEMGNSKYFEHHQKQKNFLGILKGYAGDSVELEADKERIKIPFALIAKANLDVASQISVDDAKA